MATDPRHRYRRNGRRSLYRNYASSNTIERAGTIVDLERADERGNTYTVAGTDDTGVRRNADSATGTGTNNGFCQSVAKPVRLRRDVVADPECPDSDASRDGGNASARRSGDADTDALTKPEPYAAPRTDAHASAKSKPDSHSGTRSGACTHAGAKTEPDSVPSTRSGACTHASAKTEPDSGTSPRPSPCTHADFCTGASPDPGADADSRTRVRPGPGAEADPCAGADPGTCPDADAGPSPRPSALPDADAGPSSCPSACPDADAGPSACPGTCSDADAGPSARPGACTYTDSGARTCTESSADTGASTRAPARRGSPALDANARQGNDYDF